jgi:putative flippase GtrA
MGNKERNTLREFFRFNLVGAINTFVSLMLYFGLVYIDVYYLFALVADYLFGIVFGFFMNKTYTFRIRERASVSMSLKMVYVYLLIFLLNIILLVVSVEMIGLNEYLGQITSFAVLVVVAFFAQKYYVFRIHDISVNQTD